MAFAGANFGVVLKALAAAIPKSRPALVHGPRVVTWDELDALSDRIATGLRRRGLGPGAIAGQMQRNTPEYLLAWFGCVKAGVVPVNVNYHYRQRELADIVTRFGMKALFTESDFAETAREAMPEGGLTIDVGGEEWAVLCASNVPEDFAIHDDAEALFLKGRDIEAELTAASKCWTIDAELIPSVTDSLGRIVRVRSVEPLRPTRE